MAQNVDIKAQNVLFINQIGHIMSLKGVNYGQKQRVKSASKPIAVCGLVQEVRSQTLQN